MSLTSGEMPGQHFEVGCCRFQNHAYPPERSSLHVSMPGWIYATKGIPRGEKESPFIRLIPHFQGLGFFFVS
jgi:hypothetical protein